MFRLTSATATAVALSLAIALPAAAQSVTNVQFQNGITISGATEDLSGDPTAFARRVGFFSDIYYDPNRNEWWGLSDRGPGGGSLPYETRVNRFTISHDPQGRISNFNIVQTVKFSSGGQALNGLAPSNSAVLGNSFDPEGLVVNPLNGNIIVSDEYGPSVVEFDRAGKLVMRYTVPSNLVPQANGTPNYIATPPTLSAGREPNRGFEGLAISPDGKYVYAVLQDGTVADGWSPAGGGTRGQYTRIVKFDVVTGQQVGQFAYKLNSSGQGRGISSLVALGNDKFLILERNNRGIGIGANIASPDKKVYAIDLAGATDVTGINLPATGNLPSGYVAVSKSATPVIDLAANTLSAIGNKSPEKWEGLAIGPRLANGKYLILAGTDNDYSVTQNASNVQFDVYLKFSDADPYASSIQCAIGGTTSCFRQRGSTGIWDVSTLFDPSYALLPGVLHSYTADINGYVTPVPEPATVALLAFGLAGVGLVARRRRAS